VFFFQETRISWLYLKRTHNQNFDLKNARWRLAAVLKYQELEMWANAQRDGRPAEYRWRPLFNAAKSG